MPGFLFPSRRGLEPVRRADIDNDGVPALHKAGYIILGGLDHPFEAGRNVPVAGDREVRAAAEVDTARPVADVVGADTCQRIDMPVGGDVEQLLYVGADIHRATRLAKGQDTGSYTPVVGDAVLSGRTDTEDGSVGTRIRVYPDFGANSPVALVLCRNRRYC